MSFFPLICLHFTFIFYWYTNLKHWSDISRFFFKFFVLIHIFIHKLIMGKKNPQAHRNSLRAFSFVIFGAILPCVYILIANKLCLAHWQQQCLQIKQFHICTTFCIVAFVWSAQISPSVWFLCGTVFEQCLDVFKNKFRYSDVNYIFSVCTNSVLPLTKSSVNWIQIVTVCISIKPWICIF